MRRSRLITDNSRRYLRQVADRSDGHCTSPPPPSSAKTRAIICGERAAKYYLIANSTFARAALPLPAFEHPRTAANRPRSHLAVRRCTRSFARCALRCEISSGRVVFGRRCEGRTQRHAGNHMIAVRLWSSRCRERVPGHAGRNAKPPAPDTTRPGCTSRALSIHHLRRRYFAVTTLPNWLSNGL